MKLNCHCGAVEAEINSTVNELEKKDFLKLLINKL